MKTTFPISVRASFVRAAVAALVLAPVACSGTGAYALRPAAFRADPNSLRVGDEECVRWLSRRRTWSALSLGFGAGAGGGGAVTAAADVGDGGRIAVGVGTLVLGAAGVLSGALARGYSDDFDRYCAAR